MSNYKAYLRKQPTYDEITGYIHFGQDRITYPDRSATFMRDSPYLGIYDGITFRELEDQEQKIETEKLKEAQIRRVAGEQGITHVVPEKQPPKPTISALDAGGGDSQSSSWTSAPSTMSIFEGVRRKFSTKKPDPDAQAIALGDDIERERQEIQNQTDQERSKIKGAATNVLANTGSAVKSAAGTLANVAQKGLSNLSLDDLKTVGAFAGNVVGTNALNAASALGRGAFNVAYTATDNFIHNVKVTAQEFMDMSKLITGNSVYPNIAALRNNGTKKPSTKLVMNAIREAISATQQYRGLLEGPRSAEFIGDWQGASSSSSSGPTSYGPDAPPPSSQPSHGTGYEKYKSVDDWLKYAKTKQKLYDQLTKREGYGLLLGIVDPDGYNKKGDSEILKTKLLKLSREQMAELIIGIDKELGNI